MDHPVEYENKDGKGCKHGNTYIDTKQSKQIISSQGPFHYYFLYALSILSVIFIVGYVLREVYG